MAQNYSKNHKVRVFKEGDIITLRVPREDRAATNSKQISGQIIGIPHPGKHRIQTKYGILKCLEGTKDMNGVPEDDCEDWITIFENAFSETITLHKAAAMDSTSTRINVSCSCQKRCIARCRYVKNRLKCTQYCHGDRRDSGAMGTILESTEESIIERVNLIGQPDSGTTTPLAKRTRSKTISAPKSPPTKRAKKRPQLQVENENQLQQVTLSQFTSMEPTVRRLETLQKNKRTIRPPSRFLD
ncbi:MAG: hypothetical protein M1829_001370 [Trizodia sp. TS-e1964]|nr:MAG: hypothetical protein M1829_001370 [Trizodia sp. TS-e1964]